MTTVTLTNGRMVQTGCYVDGHWGIYAIDHMMDQCAELVGFVHSNGNDEMADADKLEEALNAVTPEGFLWHWADGEFFLSPWCGWDYPHNQDGIGHDESCACWSMG